MKTKIFKSLVLVGMMSVSTVMFGNTNVKNNHKSETRMEMNICHDRHCMDEMHSRHHDKHCKCLCHCKDNRDKKMDRSHQTDNRGGQIINCGRGQQNGQQNGQMNQGGRR